MAGRRRSTRAFRCRRANLSSGRLPLPNEYLMRFSGGRCLPEPHPVVERGVRAAAGRTDCIDAPTSVPGKERRLRGHQRQRLRIPGGGVESQPFFKTLGRTNASCSGARSRNHAITRCRSHQSAVRERLMLKGAYTLSRAKNETTMRWAGLMWNAPSFAAGITRWRATIAPDLPDGVRVRAAVQNARGSGMKAARAVLGDWQINGIYSAVSGTRSRSRQVGPTSTCQVIPRRPT